MNIPETAKLLAVIGILFPNARHSDVDVELQVSVWADLLGDLSYAACDRAVRSLAQTRNFAPSIAEIREYVLELERGPVRAGGEAWRDFLEAVGRYGAYRSPVFADPVVARCVTALGWQELCLSENQVADRARFIELYDRLARDQRREQQSPLLGAAREQRALRAAERTVGEVARILTGRGANDGE